MAKKTVVQTEPKGKKVRPMTEKERRQLIMAVVGRTAGILLRGRVRR